MRENENLMVPAWVTRMRAPGKEHILGDKEFGFGNSELEMPIDYTTISSVVLLCCKGSWNPREKMMNGVAGENWE